MRMVITDHNFAGEDFERAAAKELDADFAVFHATTEAEAIEAVRGADVALVNFAPMTAAALAAMNPNGVVVRYGIGFDNVDLDAATRLGVRVCNVPDYGADTVADHAVTLTLMLLRKVAQFDRALAAGGWPSATELAPIRSTSETTVGLLGTGRIALAVAKRLQPFGFDLIAHDPYANPDVAADHGITLVDLDELFRRSHALSLHAPATADTRGIVNADNLAKMPFGSFLVNTSRGALVEQDAVLDALDSGALAGVGLDVFHPEPLAPDHRLRAHPNAVLTPHAAFYSEQSLRDLQRLAAEEAARAIRGEPLRCPLN
ncbi:MULTISPECIES: C-terminal binding protein [unclassified Rhodococcus (in: high G+C Gram-positive bacteria)]|uniref:C-terminal binding protein n=1 Tax=unclassified Rhodococcus (in: high G+C Gram-positive bacteria) TaxID=192944 RepID=UPI00077A5DDB|nr:MULTISPECIES: C-terminal binding protein [unclassified Rhodococcus (in: high G+C Gram-positive bacteria)]KXX60712.1 dihydrofolate reductase [Rhodococcus sp. LB1]